MLSIERTSRPPRHQRGPRPDRTAPRWRRSNPFATRFTRPGALRFAADNPSDIRGLCERFDQLHQAAIVGPHGNGKSTLLQTLLVELRERYAQVHLWRLQAGRRVPLSLLGHILRCRDDSLTIIDGFEQLPAPLRRGIVHWVRLRHGRLLVTAHRDQPPLSTLWRAEIDYHLARRLTLRLLADYGDVRPAMMACFEAHWQRGQRNLRNLWFDMYDDFEHHRRTATR